MTPFVSVRNVHPRRFIAIALLAIGVFGIALAVVLSVGHEPHASGIPIPQPTYTIEATSGSWHASLLDLPIGQPGALQAPMPVDINGDLLPDVTVAVNLVNVNGLFNNPPQTGAIIAPNVQINRIPTAPILGQPSLPLRIDVVITLHDSGGGPDTHIRVGYDTARGGSIPPFWQATLGGLTNLFNPLQAIVDTTGIDLGLQPNLTTLGLQQVAPPYQGPLDVIAEYDSGNTSFTGDLSYNPFPRTIEATYGTNASGLNVTYSHNYDGPVDLNANLHLAIGRSVTDIQSRIDRLPKQIAADYITTSTGAKEVDYSAVTSGRLPDLQLDYQGSSPSQGSTPASVTEANIHVEGLPPTLHAIWNIGDASATAQVTTSPLNAADPGAGPGLGAVEAHITNYLGNPTTLVPFTPNTEQYVNFQQIHTPSGALERLISARVDNIRNVQFNETAAGFNATADLGDGVRPLQLHATIDDLKTINLLDATALIDPLPHHLTASFVSGVATDITQPTTISYTASEPTDVTANATIVSVGAAPGAACGQPYVICAKVGIRNLPQNLAVSLAQGGVGVNSETRVMVDDTPNASTPNIPRPDVSINAIVGVQDADSDPNVPASQPVPLVIVGNLVSIPPHIFMREVEGPDKTLQRVDLINCVVGSDLDAGTCANGMPPDSLGMAQVTVDNFLPNQRPADLPLPATTAPNYASIVARPIAGTYATVRQEIAARIYGTSQLRYINNGNEIGVRAAAGGGKDLQVAMDTQGVDVDTPTPPPPTTNPTKVHLADTKAAAVVSPMPTSIDLCIRKQGLPLTTTTVVPFTVGCESQNPFGDGSTATTPLTLAYNASTGFNAIGSYSTVTHDAVSSPVTEETNAYTFNIANVPAQLTAQVLAVKNGITRILTNAPGAGPNFDATIGTEDNFGGASCDDPNPAFPIACGNFTVDGLPPALSFLADPSNNASKIEFHACDWDFSATPPGCRASSPQAAIGSVDANFRSVSNHPGPLPVLPAPTQKEFVTLQAVQVPHGTPPDPALADSALRVQAHFDEIRNVTFYQTPDGFDAHTDLGTGTDPFAANVFMDTRTGNTTADTGALITGLATISPLPSQITISQHGPGVDQSTDPLSLAFTDNATVPVTVTAQAQINLPGAGTACGDKLIVCANVTLYNLPQTITATLARVSQADALEENVTRHLQFALDDTPTSGVPVPTIVADATMGEGILTLPALLGGGNTPFVAHLELDQFPQHVRLVTDEEETAKIDNVGGKNVRDVTSSDLSRADFFTCDHDFTDSLPCAAGTSTPLGALHLDVHDFLLRPLGFPAIQSITQPNYAVANIANGNFEAAVQAQNIQAANLANTSDTGIVALHTIIGGGQPLLVQANIQGLPLGTLTLGQDTIDNALADLNAKAVVTPLPAELTACFRRSGSQVLPPSGNPITAPCENPQPFGAANPLDPTNSPLVVAYTTPDPTATFDVSSNLSATITGIEDGTPSTPAGPYAFAGTINLTDLPASFTATILTPTSTEVATPSGTELQQHGPLHVLFKANNGAPATGPDLTFGAQYLVGDKAICEDPRPTITAFCASGELKNIPDSLDLVYNPDLTTKNLTVNTTGTGTTELDNLQLSSVSPARNADGSLVSPAVSNAIVVTGPVGATGAGLTGASLTGIGEPLAISGNLDLPKAGSGNPPSFLLQVLNGGTFGTLNAVVKNFVAPDPTANVIIPARSVLGVSTPDQYVSFIQRTNAFVASANITNVNEVGYQTEQATDGTALPTRVINVGFDRDQTARAFADIEPNPGERIIGDVTLQHIPASIDLCFRPALATADLGKHAVTPSYCDTTANNPTGPTEKEGAFEYAGKADDPGKPLNIDGYFRMLTGGGTSVLTGRTTIMGVPPIVRGTFPGNGGDMSFGGYQLQNANDNPIDPTSPVNPDPIQSIGFKVQSFDLTADDIGYSNSDFGNVLPILVPAPHAVTPSPFDSNTNPEYDHTPSNQEFIHVAIGGGAFAFAGQIGLASGPSDSAQLQHVLVGSRACAPSDFPGGVVPTDYPDFPQDNGVSTYTCVGADFDTQHNSNLAIDLFDATGGDQVLRLHDAGIENMPDWLRATISSTPTTVDGTKTGEWRVPCGPATVEKGNLACMPPLLRFDQPNNPNNPPSSAPEGPRIFGVMQSGDFNDLNQIRAKVVPLEDSTDFNTTPTPTHWSSWGADPQGVRATIADLGTNGPDHKPLGSSMQLAFRLGIPRSVTVDQVQAYPANQLQPSDKPTSGYAAGDLRFHYAVRDGSGNPVENIGQLALIDQKSDGSQMLVGAPCDGTVEGAPGADPTCGEAYANGLNIPGELGLTLYNREQVNQVTAASGDPTSRDTKYIQADVRTSEPLAAGIRMIDPNFGDPTDTGSVGRLEANLEDTASGEAVPYPDINASAAVKAADLANPLLPSFRARIELIGDTDLNTCTTACIVTTSQDIKIASVFASLNLAPDGPSQAARQVDVVVDQASSTKTGLQLMGYTTVGGDADPTAPNGNAPITVTAHLVINPLDISMQSVVDFSSAIDSVNQAFEDYVDNYVPGIGEIINLVVDIVLELVQSILNSVPFVANLDGSLDLYFSLTKATGFYLDDDLLHMKSQVYGSESSAQVGPINLFINNFNAGIELQIPIGIPGWLEWLIPIPSFTLDIPVLEFQWLAPPGDANISYPDCSAGGAFSDFIPNLTSNEAKQFGPNDGQQAFVANPLGDPRMAPTGALVGLAVIAKLFGSAFLCAFFPVSTGDYIGIDYSGATTSYHPGGFAAEGDSTANGAHGIPGQPGQPLITPDLEGAPPPPPTPLGPPPTPQVPPPPPPIKAPPPLFPNGTVTKTLSDPIPDMCGTHTYDALTVDGTINVATAPNPALAPDGRPYCDGTAPATGTSDLGTLTLQANSIVVGPTGHILANGVNTVVPSSNEPSGFHAASGNGGAGEGGDGGDGGSGAGSHGTKYGFDPTESTDIPGPPGAGPAGGAGGGVIVVHATTVTVAGEIGADGAAAPDQTGVCGTKPQPLHVPPIAGTASTGAEGSGGGAGGAIIVDGTSVSLTGSLHAKGGDGANSFTSTGGGGGGGNVVIQAPLPTASTGDVSPGAATTTGQCWDTKTGADGQAGNAVNPGLPASAATQPNVFWEAAANGASVSVPFEAAGLNGQSDGLVVNLCGITRTTSQDPASVGPIATDIDADFASKSTNPPSTLGPPTFANPCGTPLTDTPVLLGTQTVNSNQVAPSGNTPPNADAMFTFTPPAGVDNDYVGLYTETFRPKTAGTPCTSDATCVEEPLAAGVESVIGVDATAPTASIVIDPAYAPDSNQSRIQVTISATKSAALSKISYYECSTELQGQPKNFIPCAAGHETFDLTGTDGENEIDVEAIDIAGNVSNVATESTLLQTTTPDSSVTFAPAPNSNADGYYNLNSGLPTVTLHTSYHVDKLSATSPYVYKFDGGPEIPCTVLGPGTDCVVPAATISALSSGPHTFEYTAIDAAGNRLTDGDPKSAAMNSKTFSIDEIAPQAFIYTVPSAPDQTSGGDKWFSTQPFLVLGGLTSIPTAPTVSQPDGSTGLQSLSYTDNGGSTQPYNPSNPPQLVPGVHDICATATDLADNASPVACQTIRVDTPFPTGKLTADGNTTPAPDGSNGWFVTTPTVALSNFDDAGGVGAPATNEFQYRVDNGGYQTCDTDCTLSPLPDGKHIIGFTAVDQFGNRSPEKGFLLNVDTTDPTGQVVTYPNGPNGDNSYFVTQPFAQIGSADATSGVATVAYKLDGTQSPYVPSGLQLPVGTHTLCAVITDEAGNTNPGKAICQVVRVDPANPAAAVSTTPALPDGLASWFHTLPTTTAAGTDPAPSSGVTSPIPDLSTLCGYAPFPGGGQPAPAGTCISVDGAPFTPVASLGGPLHLGPGTHLVSAFTIDAAGNRSDMVTVPVNVDTTAPQVVARTYPPAAAANGWFRDTCAPSPQLPAPLAADRCRPELYLTANDGDQNSGVASLKYSLNGATPVAYGGPIPLPDGINTITYTGTDVSGNSSTATIVVPVDTIPPTVVATSPVPTIWLQLLSQLSLGNILGLSPATAQLHWQVTDALSRHEQVTVLVYNFAGAVVRVLNVGSVNTTPGVTYSGSTTWDGKDETLTGLLPVGLYYYRVVAVDDAGNVAQSGESAPIQIRVGLPTSLPALPLPPLPPVASLLNGPTLIHVVVNLSTLI